MNLDLIFILAIVIFVLRGWWRGFIEGLCGLVGFICGYVGAYAFCQPVSEVVKRYLPAAPLPLSLALSGFLIFLAFTSIASLIGYFIRRWKMGKLEGEELASAIENDRDNGATLGLVQGILFVLFISLILSMIPEDNMVGKKLEVADSAFIDLVRPLGPHVFGQLAAATTGSPASARVVAAVVRDPQAAQKAAQKVFTSSSIQSLVNDPSFLDKVANGDPNSVAQDPRLAGLLQDPELVGALRDLGLSDEDMKFSKEDAAKAIVQVRAVLDDVQKMALKAVESGQLPKALDTPQVRQALATGNVQELLKEPGALRQMVSGLGKLQGLSQQGLGLGNGQQ